MNKKGWMEIIEAFAAIMLVAAFLLIFLNNSNNKAEDFAYEVSQTQISILREIQTNDTLRSEIANIENTPVGWEEVNFPVKVKKKIIERTPNYLKCVAKICNNTETCTISGEEGKDIYANYITITTTLETEVFRRINLFCWTK